ncbi:MAG: methylmalonyl-CoA carboxyltransferase, partial [Chloroflexi bacterium]|nr:methylmalonyl-CoA carboxyltransferase [Chloroflexota bacterium]
IGDQSDDMYRRAEALNNLVPTDPSIPYSMREAIELIFDKGSFLELQKGFAGNAIVGFARLAGQPVAIVSQEPADRAGLMDVDASDKIARMVNLADSFNLPIITFVDSPGFLPGVDQEYRGVIRHGAKVLYTYANATVPLISVVTRKAYGGAYVVLSSKFMGTDICYAWPSAEIAVMGAEGAANILYGKQIRESENPEVKRAELTAEYQEEFLNPFAAAKAGYIDEVIEPAETRRKLAEALHALRNKVDQNPPRKHGNMPV